LAVVRFGAAWLCGAFAGQGALLICAVEDYLLILHVILTF